MRIEDITNQCTACTACKSMCPKQCISMEYNKEGFLYPHIDYNACIKCGACERVCHCLNPIKVNKEHKTYIGHSIDEKILQSSSSGGAFYHISQNILKKGGLVVGASFDYHDKILKHVSTDKVELNALQKSKYLESNLENIFFEIQNNINNGRNVLFCGTPCQVSGLKRAINDPKNKLITCDFVCHGVPSTILFREHLKEKFRDKIITEIDFRPKNVSWGKIYIYIYGNNLKYFKPYYLDSFYLGFIIQNAFLRKSCYDCQFRRHHYSDITLADFWNWKEYDPTMHVKNGMSLIISNTENGNKIINNIENFKIREIDNHYSDYVYENKDYTRFQEIRKEFYRLYYLYGFEKAAKMTYFKNIKFQEYKYYIKRILHREP